MPFTDDDPILTQMRESGIRYDQSLAEQTIPADVLAMVSRDLATKYHLLPMFKSGETLTIVTDTAEVFKNQQQIEKQIGCSIRPLIAQADNVKQGLYQHYGIESYRSITANSGGDRNEDITPLKGKCTSLLQNAAAAKASDIHILPFSGGVRVEFLVDGHLIDMTDTYAFAPEEAINITNIFKTMTEGQAESNRINMPDSGSFIFYHGTTPIFVRLATCPVGSNANGAQTTILRLLPQGNKKISIEEIGYLKDDLDLIRNTLFRSANGLFLNSGPTGSGKTTSLYAQIDFIYKNAGEPKTVITIDDPIEIREEKYVQIEVHEAAVDDSSLTKAKIMKFALRADPQIILYNEIRDKEDAIIALQASATGHPTFATVHASNCIKTISRLLDLEISKVTLLSELKMIISQRLVGCLCPHCSKPHTLTEQEKAVLSETEIKALEGPNSRLMERGSIEERRACKHCHNGLIGRVAVAEIVVFNDEIRDALLNQRSFSSIRKVLADHGFKDMWTKGLPMVMSGRVELQEVIHEIGKE